MAKYMFPPEIKKFPTNCSLPDPTRGQPFLVEVPNTRSTTQILWTCLSILVLCTYTVLHLNVPPQDPREGKWDIKRTMRRLGTKLLWMAFTMLAPEYLLGKAYSDLISARKHREQYLQQASKDHVDWSLSHVFLANMGGFTITFDSNATATRYPSEGQSRTQRSKSADAVVQYVHSASVNQSMDDGPFTINDHTEQNGVSSSTSFVMDLLKAPAVHMTDDSDRLSAWSQGGILTDKDSTSRAATVSESTRTPSCTVKPNVSLEDDKAKANPVAIGALQAFRMNHNIQKKLQADNEEASVSSSGNAPKMRAAVKQTTTDTFATNWEKMHFTRNWQHWCQNLQALKGDVWVLDACQLLLAREMGIISSLPSLPQDQLDDRNKSNLVVKCLALWQVIWLFIQVVARALSSLPTSQLEIVALAFALLTLITNFFMWNKPQDIKTAVTIKASRAPSAEEMARIAINGPTVWGLYRLHQCIPNNASHCNKNIPEHHNDKMRQCAAYGAAFFGVVHLVTWNFHFPTHVESLLWKAASFTTILTVFAAWFLYWSLKSISYLCGLGIRLRIGQVVTTLAVSVYVLARIYITVEMFRSLFYLDRKTFISTFATYIPHIG